MKEYTEEDIRKFPLWMGCCWVVAPWSSNVKFESVEDWAEKHGFMFMFCGCSECDDEMSSTHTVEQAAKRVNDIFKLFEFYGVKYNEK